MASEKFTLRLSAKDPTEAEIIAILNGKPDGRKASWLRDVLVVGYRSMSEAGTTLPAVSLNMPVASVVEVDKEQPQVIAPASQSKEPVAKSESYSSTPDALPPAVTEQRKTTTGGASALAGLTGYANKVRI